MVKLLFQKYPCKCKCRYISFAFEFNSNTKECVKLNLMQDSEKSKLREGNIHAKLKSSLFHLKFRKISMLRKFPKLSRKNFQVKANEAGRNLVEKFVIRPQLTSRDTRPLRMAIWRVVRSISATCPITASIFRSSIAKVSIKLARVHIEGGETGRFSEQLIIRIIYPPGAKHAGGKISSFIISIGRNRMLGGNLPKPAAVAA